MGGASSERDNSSLKPGLVMPTCNHSFEEADAGGLDARGQPVLYSEF